MFRISCRRSSLDEREGAGVELMASSAEHGDAGTRENEQPLVGAAMPIVRATLAVARRNDHRGGLTTLVAHRDREAFPETEVFGGHLLGVLQSGQTLQLPRQRLRR